MKKERKLSTSLLTIALALAVIGIAAFLFMNEGFLTDFSDLFSHDHIPTTSVSNIKDLIFIFSSFLILEIFFSHYLISFLQI